MKKFVLTFLILSITALASSGAPDPSTIAIKDMFTPAEQDISISILKQMFGGSNHMIAALSGPQNELITKMFSTLNLGVLFIASIIFSYTVSTGVMRTAQDGGMSQMGKITPLSSFRIFSGLTLLMPIPNMGLSTIQMGVLWAAVHGIGFADTIFSYVAYNFMGNNVSVQAVASPDYNIKAVVQRLALKRNTADKKDQLISDYDNKLYEMGDEYSYSYLENVDMILKQSQALLDKKDAKNYQKANRFLSSGSGSTVNGPIKGKAVNYSEIVAAAMCLAVIDNYYTGPNSSCKESCQKGFAVRTSSSCSNDGSINLCFGYSNNPSFCGGYKVKGFDLSSIYSNSLMNFSTFKQKIPEYKSARKGAIFFLNFLKDLPESAKKLLTEQYKERNLICQKNDCLMVPQLSLLATDLVRLIPDPKEPKSAADIMKNSGVAKEGWLAAGYNISNISNGFEKTKTKYDLPNISVFDEFVSLMYNRIRALNNDSISEQFDLKSNWFGSGASLSVPQVAAKYIFLSFIESVLGVDISKTVPECAAKNPKGCFNKAVKNKFIISPSDPVSTSKPSAGILGSIAAFSNAPFADNPIQQVKKTGIGLLNTVYNAWKDLPPKILKASATLAKNYKSKIIGISTVSVAIQSALEFIPPAGVLPIGHFAALALDAVTRVILIIPQLYYQFDINQLFLYLPVVGALTVAIFGIAFLLAVWVPLLPMIIFCFAVIGWLASLIEAMVAAPLVAVGMTHPEGHDFLGQAQQSVMLLLIVFLRPVLILFGLITAVLLFYFTVYLTNIGFVTVLLNIMQSDDALQLNLYFALILLCFFIIYGYILSSVATMTYSNIFRVPERIVIWIGGQPEQSAISQLLNKVKAQSGQELSGASMGGGQSVTEMSKGRASVNADYKPASGESGKKKDHKASS